MTPWRLVPDSQRPSSLHIYSFPDAPFSAVWPKQFDQTQIVLEGANDLDCMERVSWCRISLFYNHTIISVVTICFQILEKFASGCSFPVATANHLPPSESLHPVLELSSNPFSLHTQITSLPLDLQSYPQYPSADIFTISPLLVQTNSVWPLSVQLYLYSV